MAAPAGKRLTTLCVTFDEAAYDESEYAKIVADRFETNHLEVRVREREFVDDGEAGRRAPDLGGTVHAPLQPG